MESLKSHDWVALGQLSSTRGMQLLLESLQAEEDTALEEVENAEDKTKEERLVMRWRCIRQVRGHIVSLLEFAEKEVNNLTYGGSADEEE